MNEKTTLKILSLYLAWVIAVISVLLSLYFSEIKNLPICHLCWYQRICMYPLAIVLGIAAYRADRQIAIYTIPLTVFGLIFSGYQYLEQMIPGFSPIQVCKAGIDCSQIHLLLFGFITLPFLSLLAFLAMTLLLWYSKVGSDLLHTTEKH